MKIRSLFYLKIQAMMHFKNVQPRNHAVISSFTGANMVANKKFKILKQPKQNPPAFKTGNELLTIEITVIIKQTCHDLEQICILVKIRFDVSKHKNKGKWKCEFLGMSEVCIFNSVKTLYFSLFLHFNINPILFIRW